MELLFELSPDLPRDSLRLVSHTLKNLTDDAGAEALDHLVRVLPILSASMKLGTGADKLEVSHELQKTLQYLPVSEIHEALACSERSEYQTVLARLVVKNSALHDLCVLPQREARNQVFLSSELSQVFGAPDVPTPLKAIWELEHSSSRSLRILSRLEEFWSNERLQDTQLSQRSIRFELSAIQHLRDYGILPAVRAALAFAGRPELIHELDVFRDDTSLRLLAEALLKNRHRVLSHVKGLLPLNGLADWVDYLRGPCSELAESRGITRTEAISFAHFAMHLMNLCDLIEELGSDIHDAIRRSVSDVEDSLKEFANMRIADGVRDCNSLERAIAPWGPRLDLHRLADRIARLNGCWSGGGSSKGLVGMGRLDLEVCGPYIDALHRLEPPSLERVANVLRYAEFRRNFGGWRIDYLVSFLVMISRALPELSSPVILDFDEIINTMDACPALGQVFIGDAESSIRIRQNGAVLAAHLELDLELKALLDLVSHSTDQRVLQLANGRIHDMLSASTPVEELGVAML